jgi:hypothetical protein
LVDVMVMQRLFARVCASACCNHIRVEPGHAVLLLLLQAGAAEKGVPLYKYIAQLAGNSKLVRRRQRPADMYPVLPVGRAAISRQRVCSVRSASRQQLRDAQLEGMHKNKNAAAAARQRWL